MSQRSSFIVHRSAFSLQPSAFSLQPSAFKKVYPYDSSRYGP
jgi:hypothetical protein